MYLSVRAGKGHFSGGRNGVVDCYLSTDGVRGGVIELFGQETIAPLDAGYIMGVVFAKQGERASLAVVGPIDILELVQNDLMVSTSMRVLEDGKGQAGESFHERLVKCQLLAALAEWLQANYTWGK